jgi:hypothetical protein
VTDDLADACVRNYRMREKARENDGNLLKKPTSKKERRIAAAAGDDDDDDDSGDGDHDNFFSYF